MAECKRQKEVVRKPKRVAPDGKVAASLYLAGKTTREVGEQLNCHQKTVCRLLKQQGVEARAAAPSPSISADVDRVAELYSAGHSARSIGKILGRNRGTIIRALGARGITIRSTNKSVCSNDAANSQGSAA
jgi:DNA-binding CsgD family transcriptional regulator